MVPRMVCGRRNFQNASRNEVEDAEGAAMGCVPPACGGGVFYKTCGVFGGTFCRVQFHIVRVMIHHVCLCSCV